MYGEAKKIHLIEAILKIENDAELAEVETALNKSKIASVTPAAGGKSFKDFAGIWTAAEADEMTKIIEDSCEQINPDDWK
jgi:hypothetical protein